MSSYSICEMGPGCMRYTWTKATNLKISIHLLCAFTFIVLYFTLSVPHKHEVLTVCVWLQYHITNCDIYAIGRTKQYDERIPFMTQFFKCRCRKRVGIRHCFACKCSKTLGDVRTSTWTLLTTQIGHVSAKFRQFDCLFNCLSSSNDDKIVTRFLRGISTGDWWIPLTKCQSCGKRFHVMTSSWNVDQVPLLLTRFNFNPIMDK